MKAGTSQPSGLDPATTLTIASSAAWESKWRQSWSCCVTIPLTSSCWLIFLLPPKDPCSFVSECPELAAVEGWYAVLVKGSAAGHPKAHAEQLRWAPAASWPPFLAGPIVHSLATGAQPANQARGSAQGLQAAMAQPGWERGRGWQCCWHWPEYRRQLTASKCPTSCSCMSSQENRPGYLK